ncbi:MAG: dTDP-4-dehydrorhamnose reductase [Parcubacteria group bacterium LiPW_72]|nr:MAG: dTDP-4-dehydrorhamnose reductase [Parcubacteria group bacterium LiPW_72]
MNNPDLKKITAYLKNSLSEDRFFHSLAVAKTAEKMAKIIGGVNPAKAYFAGLIHDMARDLPEATWILLAKKYRIKIDIFTKKHILLLHAAVGAKLAQQEFNVRDRTILQAIERHCVPKINMDILDKIIYLADVTAPAPKGGVGSVELKEVLSLTRKSLDRALLYTYNEDIKEFVRKGMKIHPDLIRSRNKLLENFGKKILILGSKGMLGRALVQEFQDCELTLWDKNNADITKRKTLRNKISRLKPDIIINAAAYTNVEEAEGNQEQALKVNGKAVGYLAQIAKKLNAILVHYSTDYVFEGKNRKGYKETIQPNPINVYGKSKFLGEALLRRHCEQYYLIRSSWLFGKEGINFVDKILQKAQSNATLTVVNDQWGKPTYTRDLARATRQILEQERPFGVYHITNEGKTNWYQFARKILLFKGIKAKMKPISSQEYHSRAKRPMYSILLNTKLPHLRHWEEALEEYLNS